MFFFSIIQKSKQNNQKKLLHVCLFYINKLCMILDIFLVRFAAFVENKTIKFSFL